MTSGRPAFGLHLQRRFLSFLIVRKPCGTEGVDICYSQESIGSISKLMKDTLCEHRFEFRFSGAEPAGGFLQSTEYSTHDRYSHLSGVQRDSETRVHYPVCPFCLYGAIGSCCRLLTASEPRPQ